MIDIKKHWWPLATSRELDQHKVLSRRLDGLPLVLFRGSERQPAILFDRCAHRHAPLSAGRLVKTELECLYHGWRFAFDGKCTKVPGQEIANGKSSLVRSVLAHEESGLIWGCLEPNEKTPPPVLAASISQAIDVFFFTDTVRCSIAEASENFLDGFHTHFVHAGWIRRDESRQQIRVDVRQLSNGVEASYSGENLQNGLISSFLEGDRQVSMGRFKLPGVAEIEYRGQRGLNLLVTVWFAPDRQDMLRIYARVATRRGMLPKWLKELLLRRVFALVLRQDKTILERTHKNIEMFASMGAEYSAEVLNTSNDLLGSAINSLMSGMPVSKIEEKTALILL